MRIFYQSSRWNNMDLNREIESAMEDGVDGFDLFFDGYLPEDLSELELDALKSWVGQGKSFSFHLPLDSWTLEPPYVDQIMAAARIYKPLTVTVHYDRLADDVLSRLQAAFRGMAAVCVENTLPDRNAETGKNLLSWLKQRKEPVDITFDMGHARLSAGDPVKVLRDYLDAGARVSTLHAHDNHGDRDSHLSLGQGTVDVIGVLELLKERGQDPIVVLEHWTGNRDSLKYLRDRGY